MKMEILEWLNAVLSGPAIVWLIVIAGIIFSCKTGFIQVRKLPAACMQVVRSFKKGSTTGGITPFQAMATALAGTIGTGNIVGVAAAVAAGGAGALFWMWVSAFFGMATKYAEIVLAIRYRERREDGYVGGAMYYLNHAFKSRVPAGIFAVLCVLASFGIGNIVQSNAIGGALKTILPSEWKLIMVGVTLVVGFVIIGGIKRIGRLCEAAIPFMALFYMGGCIIIICMNLPAIGGIFEQILRDAFSFRAAGGGVMGFLTSRAMRIGFARGVFTNEAGLGSAPIVHAAAETKSPAQQGLMGIFEVFFDTIVMCTLTGLVVLLSGADGAGADGATVTMAAFSHWLGRYAGVFIAISCVFFAVSSVISWSYYGASAIGYLAGEGKAARRLTLLYKLIFVGAVYCGALVSMEAVWGIADLLNGLMLLPNMAGILLLADEVKAETNRIFPRRRVGLTKKAR